MRRSKLAHLWDRYDTAIAYIFIALFAVLEITTFVFPAVDQAVPGLVGLVLLCLGLLTFFRSLDSSLGQITARISMARLSDGIERLLAVERSISELVIVANDGAKYYSAISEHGGRIRRLRVVLANDSLLTNWANLTERGIVDQLEIRLQDEAPAFHAGVVPGRIAVFGAFTPRPTGGYSAGNTLLFEDGTRELRALIDVYERMFDAAWERTADRVVLASPTS